MRSPEKPKGELVIRTIAMPADTNPNGDIFGGWLMSQMDLGSGILASKQPKHAWLQWQWKACHFCNRSEWGHSGVLCLGGEDRAHFHNNSGGSLGRALSRTRPPNSG